MQKIAKIEVFDCFLGFGWSDCSDIAYVDSAKWSSWLGYGFSHIQLTQFCLTSIIQQKIAKLVVIDPSLGVGLSDCSNITHVDSIKCSSWLGNGCTLVQLKINYKRIISKILIVTLLAIVIQLFPIALVSPLLALAGPQKSCLLCKNIISIPFNP